MPVMLRAEGVDFDVDAFAVGCTLAVEAVFRRGERVYPNRPMRGRRHERSGVQLLVSAADFTAFHQQTLDACTFLRTEVEQLQRLSAFPGITVLELDFGLARREVAVQTDHLPAELVRQAGALGIGLTLSQYPIPNRTLSVRLAIRMTTLMWFVLFVAACCFPAVKTTVVVFDPTTWPPNHIEERSYSGMSALFQGWAEVLAWCRGPVKIDSAYAWHLGWLANPMCMAAVLFLRERR